MCSIIGSFSKDKILQLIALNAYRGQHSWSLSYYNPNQGMVNVSRGMGEIPKDKIDIHDDDYCIVHMQAPTTDNKDMNTVHPANIDGRYLWHNGIVKAEWVKKRITESDRYSSWDTHLILKQYVEKRDLNNIDGTFACLLYDDKKLYLFRNEISPLFIDKYNNISSTRFEGAHMIRPNIVWQFLSGADLIETDIKFDTVENPYYGLDL